MILSDLAVFVERVMTPIIDPSQPLFSLYQPIKISHLLKTSTTTLVLFFLMSTGICISNIFTLALSFKPVWLLLHHLHGRFDLITAPLLLASVPHPRGRTRVWEDILNSGVVHALVSISLWIQNLYYKIVLQNLYYKYIVFQGEKSRVFMWGDIFNSRVVKGFDLCPCQCIRPRGWTRV